MAAARYDGVAEWYDEHVAWSSAAAAPLLARLAGRGSGRCLDVGCGTGVHLTALAGMGWSVVGVDVSADQLRVAGRRAGPVVVGLVQADAARLPFRAGRPAVQGRLEAAWPAGSGSGTFLWPVSSTTCWRPGCGFVAWRKPG